jgi:PIN domain nuclease of toxin-antitoxin system
MRLLLDAHVWLWLLDQPNRIAEPVLEQIDEASELLLSTASIWELAIKHQLGELGAKTTVAELRDEILREMAATELAITASHALVAAHLPMLHKDPFDRMLIAQGQFERVAFVAADAALLRYGGDMLWAGN